jgi:hypothetical protein
MKLIPYLQSDPRWGNVLIAPSVTLSAYGCLISVLSDMLRRTELDLDPGRLCEALKRVNAFSTTGDMTLDKLEQVTNRVTFHSRKATTNYAGEKYGGKMDPQAALDRIRNLIMLGMPVPVHVDAVGNDKYPDHFVLAVDLEGSDLIIHDPAYGEEVRFTKRYGDPLTGIYGYAAYILQPTEAPIGGHLKFGQSLAKMSEAWRQMPDGPARQMVSEAMDSMF